MKTPTNETNAVVKKVAKKPTPPPVVKVGDVFTEYIGSDRYGHTVTAVSANGKTLIATDGVKLEWIRGNWVNERFKKYKPYKRPSLRFGVCITEFDPGF